MLYLKRTRFMLRANGLKKKGTSIVYIISSLRKEGNWLWCSLAAYEGVQKSNVFFFMKGQS